MKFIGLLMVADENDVLDRTLAHNARFVDWFYALDGTSDRVQSSALITSHPKCAAYLHDENCGVQPRDGWRQHLLDLAVLNYGPDHWFLLLHGDEVWTADPRETVAAHPGHDHFLYRLPVYFPRAGEPWNYKRHPLDQLRWNLGPGWPEVRLFRGGEGVAFDPRQHFNVTPSGLRSLGASQAPIKHYPYRAPDVQRARARRHQTTGFDPDNYRHILDHDAVYWDDGRIEAYRQNEHFRDLRRD